MGYEIKVIAGEVSIFNDRQAWFQVYGMVDICKPGYDSAIYKLNQDPSHRIKKGCYMYADDGNTQIIEDKYGSDLIPIPIQRVINALKDDVKKSEYRRFQWALEMLESMAKTDKDIEVILFGY